MDYKVKILEDIKEAMKSKDSEKSGFLRTLISSFNNEAINLKKKDDGLTKDEQLKVLKREAKKHKDSIKQFESAGRNDLAETEKKELEILQTYLPEEMSEEEIKKNVEEVLAEMGEVAPSQFGQIMSKVMEKTGGQADGSLVSKIVKENLNK
jgi:uncharacterized protein YqeY